MQRKFLFCALTSSFFVLNTQAQNTSPFWSLAGNSNANSISKLGTTTADPLNLTTNNLTRLRIGADGKVGIGTSSPQQLFHVEGSTLLSIFVSTSPLSNISGSGMIGYTKFLPTASGQRLGYFLLGSRGGAENNYNAAGMVGYAAGSWTAGSSYPSYLAFETTPSGSASRSERLRIGSDGNVGIGTTNPATAGLVVDKKEGGTNAIFGSNTTGTSIQSSYPGIGFNTYFNSGHKYIGSGYGGYLGADPTIGGIVLFVTPSSGAANAAAGLSEGLRVTRATNVGIGNSDPSNKLVVTDNTQIAAAAVIQNLYTAGSYNDGLYIYAGRDGGTSPGTTYHIGFYTPGGGLLGSISQASATSIAYNTTSDKRLKTNIRETHFGLADLNKIEVKDYNFIGSKTPQTGFLAQQLYEVFPEAVSKGGDDPKIKPWMVDYGRVTPLLVKAVQELSKKTDEIEELKKKNDILETRLQKLETMLLKSNNGSSLSATHLEAPIPNPSSGSALVKYVLPDEVSDAKLTLINAKGQLIKTFRINGRGAGQLNVNTGGLPAGVYTYSLLIDGKETVSKQLVVAR